MLHGTFIFITYTVEKSRKKFFPLPGKSGTANAVPQNLSLPDLLSLIIHKGPLTDSARNNRTQQRQCFMALGTSPLEKVDQIEPDHQHNGCITGIQAHGTFRAVNLTKDKTCDNQRNRRIQAIKADPAPSVVWLIF